jgi:hypothetical protein
MLVISEQVYYLEERVKIKTDKPFGIALDFVKKKLATSAK